MVFFAGQALFAQDHLEPASSWRDYSRSQLRNINFNEILFEDEAFTGNKVYLRYFHAGGFMDEKHSFELLEIRGKWVLAYKKADMYYWPSLFSFRVATPPGLLDGTAHEDEDQYLRIERNLGDDDAWSLIELFYPAVMEARFKDKAFFVMDASNYYFTITLRNGRLRTAQIRSGETQKNTRELIRICNEIIRQMQIHPDSIDFSPELKNRINTLSEKFRNSSP